MAACCSAGRHGEGGRRRELRHRQGRDAGLVGESGCGKSTVGKTILKLIEPTAGRIVLGGEDITALKPGAMWPHRRRIQTIFQDPYSSMNPRLPAGTIVGEPLENFGIAPGSERDERGRRCSSGSACARCDAQVRARILRRPAPAARHRQGAGGQPDVIVADEPVSALDVSVQAQVLNLLIDLQEEYGLAYLFISHDLAVMRHISHRIAVMYLGRIVELTDKRTLFAEPLHPYTEALLSAATAPDPRRRRRKRRSCRATCRAPPSRRPAATSTRAAPMRSPSAR
jgi:peptide/nickel transport system ATP-binding protein/oligopeptide transport system ATP-binding protein